MQSIEQSNNLLHPLEYLLENWREKPLSPDDLDALHEQAEEYIEQLHEILPLLSFPSPSCLEIDLEEQEHEFNLLQQISAHINHDMKLLEHDFDTMPIWLELAIIQERSQLLETAIRTSQRLASLKRELVMLSHEIRETLNRIYQSDWNHDFSNLLEARREHILDVYEAIRQQLNLYQDLYEIDSLLSLFNTVKAMLENLDETLDAMVDPEVLNIGKA